MYQRINITLPNETLQLLDRTAPKGDRSHFIDQAVKYYVNAEAKKNLREKLKQGALRWADRDLGITQDWFNIGVAAITSQFDTETYPTEVLINPSEGGLTTTSVVLLNQIRSIDK